MNENTFHEVTKFIDTQVKLLRDLNPELLIFLLGNKSDLKDKIKISFEEGRNLAQMHDFYFFQISLVESDSMILQNFFYILLSGVRYIYLKIK